MNLFKFKSVSVIGLGYIGLPTAALLSKNGYFVKGIDINKNLIQELSANQFNTTEKGLGKILKKEVKANRLLFSENFVKSDVHLIAVPTPTSFKNGALDADLKHVFSAIHSISPYLEKGNLIIIESTSPVGTTKKIVKKLAKLRPDLNFSKNEGRLDVNIAYCPERIIPGNMVFELINNDRVIGGVSKECSKKASIFYNQFINGKCYETDSSTAEMVKLTENSFRDVQIAFANEMSMICEKHDIDVWELIKLANYHPRVNILNPGPGVGGHCIAVDPWFVIQSAPKISKLIKTAREVNKSKTNYVIKKIIKEAKKLLKANPKRKKINVVCYGLSYKPDTDDLRESPALEITLKLAKAIELNVFAVEPNILKTKKIRGVRIISLEEGLAKSGIDVILVSHKEFKKKTIKFNNVLNFVG